MLYCPCTVCFWFENIPYSLTYAFQEPSCFDSVQLDIFELNRSPHKSHVIPSWQLSRDFSGFCFFPELWVWQKCCIFLQIFPLMTELWGIFSWLACVIFNLCPQVKSSPMMWILKGFLHAMNWTYEKCGCMALIMIIPWHATNLVWIFYYIILGVIVLLTN